MADIIAVDVDVLKNLTKHRKGGGIIYRFISDLLFYALKRKKICFQLLNANMASLTKISSRKILEELTPILLYIYIHFFIKFLIKRLGSKIYLKKCFIIFFKYLSSIFILIRLKFFIIFYLNYLEKNKYNK